MSFQYGYLKGTIRAVIGDTDGDGDHFPDIVHIDGLKAEVVPSPPRLTDSAAKITYFTAPIALGFDNGGVLRLLHHIDGDGDPTPDAVSEIPLIAQDDDDLNPSGGWTYQVTITAPGIPTWSFPFQVNTGEVHDLSEIAPVAQSSGVITTRGPEGRSAYELAVEQGFVGSLEDYLASLHGEDGAASMARGGAADLDAMYGAAYAGSWHGNSAPTRPAGAQNGPVLVAASTLAATSAQIYTEPITGRMWSRAYSAYMGAWSDWKRLDLHETTANELRGTGSPLGVVAADPGTYYTDTEGTFGAWRWLKTSGTGTSGWTVVFGDTGVRKITLNFPEYPALNALLVRRSTENGVEWKFNANGDPSEGTYMLLDPIPVGWRPWAANSNHYAIGDIANAYIFGGNPAGSWFTINGATPALRLEQVGSTQRSRGHLQHGTNDPWPTAWIGDPA